MMKKVWTCDVCQREMPEDKVHEAELKVKACKDTYVFHVCDICFGESPKGVFQKAFNQLWRLLRRGNR